MKDRGTISITKERLMDFCVRVLVSAGAPQEYALTTSEVLVEADLRGMPSHGCGLLPWYAERIRNGEINAKAKIKIVKSSGATLLIDGGNGLGQVITKYGMQKSIDGAKRHGVFFTGIRGSNHFGMAAFYALLAVPNNMIGIVLTISGRNTMAPWGGIDLLLGNNPIAIAIPAGEEFPFVYDGSFSVAAWRKISLAIQRGEKSIPEGWALDSEGNPTQDPKTALDGMLVPMGGYKGYGLTFAVSILAGTLMGAAYGKSVKNSNVGHVAVAIDISAFANPDDFKNSVDVFIRDIKNSRKPPECERIYIPGERGFDARDKYTKSGIPFDQNALMTLQALALELGIEPLASKQL